ncbi:MAG: hypothetical protein WC712_08825 [Candidatus Brocadiia bacterium]
MTSPRRSARWSVACVALLIAACAMTNSCVRPIAQVKALKITGAQLALLQGSPEDMMRNPRQYRTDSPYPYDYYTELAYSEPRLGDLVQVCDESSRPNPIYWPEVTCYWEKCGPTANFDFRDHLGYLNGRVFAILLSSSGTWQWLAEANEEDLAGVRYIEVQGVPPANYASLLARLPKNRIVVRFDPDCFPSWTDALVPIKPVGLMLQAPEGRTSLDFGMFRACTFLSVELSETAEVRLPPSLKILHLTDSTSGLAMVRGAESSLTAIRLAGVSRFSDWLPNYSALQDVVEISEYLEGDEYTDFTSSVEQLHSLRFLSFEPGRADLSFLSSLGELKCLSLASRVQNLSTVAGLAKLEYLRLCQSYNSDLTALAAMSKLKYIDLSFSGEYSRAVSRPKAFDLAVLAPVADKIHRLDIGQDVPLLHPETMATLVSLECLTSQNLDQKTLDSLSSLANLRRISVFNLPAGGLDLSPLAKVPHLESLCLESASAIDLSGLRDCLSLRELKVKTRSSLNVESLASLTSLTRLDLFSGPATSARAREKDLSSYRSLSQLRGLVFLELDISGLKSLDFVESSESLAGLALCRFEGSDLTVLGKLKSLRYLSLSSCEQISDYSVLLPGDLRALELSGCDSLWKLPFLAGARNLASLEIRGCSRIEALARLPAPLAHLTFFRAGYCRYLKNTSGLVSMPALEILVLEDYEGTEVAGFDSLKSLRYVACSPLHLPRAAPGTPIVGAWISADRKPNSLEGIETWTELRSLQVRLGSDVSDLTPLLSLKKLDSLWLREGYEIKDISPLAKMTWLKSLHFRDCCFVTEENIEILKKALPGCDISVRDDLQREEED